MKDKTNCIECGTRIWLPPEGLKVKLCDACWKDNNESKFGCEDLADCLYYLYRLVKEDLKKK